MEFPIIAREYIEELSHNEVIESVVKAFKGFIDPGVVQPSRQELILDNPPRFFGSMPCYIIEYDVISVKLITYFFENPKLYGLKPFNSVVILFSGKDGRILSLLDGDIITTLRTAGMGVVSTKYLLGREPKSICIVGVGVQGRMQVELHLKSFSSIENINIVNRTFEKAVKYSEDLEATYNVSAEAYQEISEAVKDVDVVIAATSSTSPVIPGKYLPEGVHVISIGYISRDSRELDDECISRADYIFVDSPDAYDSGDIRIPIEKGLINRDDVKLISELILGRVSGRASDKDITVFKSVGTAVQDGYLAYNVYQRFVKER